MQYSQYTWITSSIGRSFLRFSTQIGKRTRGDADDEISKPNSDVINDVVGKWANSRHTADEIAKAQNDGGFPADVLNNMTEFSKQTSSMTIKLERSEIEDALSSMIDHNADNVIKVVKACGLSDNNNDPVSFEQLAVNHHTTTTYDDDDSSTTTTGENFFV